MDPNDDVEIALLVLRSDDGGAATLTLNRADKRNALSLDVFRALDRHLAVIEQQADSTGLVILRAAGPVFSAGADLGKQQRPPFPNFQAKTIDRLANLPQPVLAAVHGPCLTGGLELILAADIIIASDSAQFADTHGKFALVPGWGLTARLPRRIGEFKAREMMLSGRTYDARTAQAMGLVSQAVPDDRFEEEVAAMARDILAQSWHSLRGYKQLLNQGRDLPLGQGLANEIFNSPGIGSDFADRASGFRKG